MSQWSHIDTDPIMPPKRRTMPGKPKKNEKETADERENATAILKHLIKQSVVTIINLVITQENAMSHPNKLSDFHSHKFHHLF